MISGRTASRSRHPDIGQASVAFKVTGFTLVELLVVMAILALLLTMATPKYFNNIEKSKEVALKHNLANMRDAIDKHYSDIGKYPETLEDLVSKKYVRKIPPDPMTDSHASWIIVPPDDAEKGGVYDIKSGAEGKARDGTVYLDW